jgi:ATP synthase protein I
MRDDKGTWLEALAASTLGWDLALPIVAGALLGYHLDRRLGTGPLLTLMLLLFGVATGFYNVVRSIQRMEARERRRAENGSPREEANR